MIFHLLKNFNDIVGFVWGIIIVGHRVALNKAAGHTGLCGEARQRAEVECKRIDATRTVCPRRTSLEV